MDILETRVLKLDKNWRPFATTSVKKAFLDAGAGAVTLLRFDNGYPTPFRLTDWLNIPVEDKEPYIGIGGKYHGETRKVAVPRVVICVGFDQVILEKQKFKKKKHLSLQELAEVYEETCAVSGVKLKPEDYSREHVRPRSKGGKSGPENEVLMDRRLNSLRGNKSYRKIGYKKPKIRPVPFREKQRIVNENGYEEWKMFGVPDS
jgi:hypothetical protein